MYCPHCGNELPNDALFCGKCGTQLENHGTGNASVHAAPTVKGAQATPLSDTDQIAIMKVAAIALGALMALAFFLTFASAFYFDISVKDIVFGSGWAYSSVDAKSRVVGALMLIAPLATIVATALAKNGKAAWIVNSVTGGFVFGLTVMTLMSLSKQGGGFVSFGAGAYLYLICSFALLVITFYAYHVASKK